MTSRNVYSKCFTLRGFLEIESRSIGMVQWFLFKCHRCSRVLYSVLAQDNKGENSIEVIKWSYFYNELLLNNLLYLPSVLCDTGMGPITIYNHNSQS